MMRERERERILFDICHLMMLRMVVTEIMTEHIVEVNVLRTLACSQ